MPFPDDPLRYYLFTAPPRPANGSANPTPHTAWWTWTQNNGNGDVVTANVLLDGPVTERLTATRHANGRDVWVLYHRWESDAYIAYLVTCQGVEGRWSPTSARPMHRQCRWLRGIHHRLHEAEPTRLPNSPAPGAQHGSRTATSDWWSSTYFDVLDFDNSTGLLSHYLSDSIGGTSELFSRGYGVEFAPNGNLVYMSDHGLLNGGGYSTIRQYDLTSRGPDEHRGGAGY